jgi:2-C-methyl-D-erythritol 4-phosphate cytidylyltransferase
MVRWSVDALRACAAVSETIVAVPAGHGQGLVGRGVSVVEGGPTRSESVFNALEGVGTELVAVHDAARPLVTPELVEALVADLRASPEAAGVIAATPVTDTIKRVGSGLVVESTEDRTQLWAAQTPQVFRVEALREALAANAEGQAAATDEAMLVEAAGGTVLMHPCGPENLKVTTPLDLRIAEMLLAEH